MPEIDRSVREYVDEIGRTVPVSPPPLETIAGRAARRTRLRAVAAGAAAVVVAGTLAGIAVTSGHRATRADSPREAAGPVRTERPSAGSAPARPTLTVRIEGTRIAPFYLPTLNAFAHSGVVDGVVAGTVTKVDYQVSTDGTNEVFTIFTVRTQDLRGQAPSRTITVRELGGIVPLREVRSDFEAHTGPIAADRLDELVDYTDGRTHPVVGETDLIFLQSLPQSDTAQYASLARMSLDRAGDRFTWAGRTPNSAWAASLSRPEAASAFGALAPTG